jgi:NSS family neurotransmitter:Na+ symporter
MATPIVAFFREEFGVRREVVAWSVGAIALAFGVLTILWFEHGFLWEWDYWAGTFGLAVMAFIEVVLFMWIFKPENAWRSLHEGADIRLPRVFRFVMTFVTPLYLAVILGWWAVKEALPILRLEGGRAAAGAIAPGSEIYVHLSRLLIVAFMVFFLVMIRIAWKRNGYDDRAGFREVEDTELGRTVA